MCHESNSVVSLHGTICVQYQLVSCHESNSVVSLHGTIYVQDQLVSCHESNSVVSLHGMIRVQDQVVVLFRSILVLHHSIPGLRQKKNMCSIRFNGCKLGWTCAIWQSKFSDTNSLIPFPTNGVCAWQHHLCFPGSWISP